MQQKKHLWCKMKNSVLIIGIDGATWALLKPWIAEGKLPTLKRLMASGIKADLKTTVPPLSCSAWTSMFTGKNPGKHGIYQYITESGKIVDSSFIRSEKIWQILSRFDKRCCVINVPLTYPAEEVNGYMISDLLTLRDEKDYFYPDDLALFLEKHDYKSSMRYEKYAFLPDDKDTSVKRNEVVNELRYVLDKRYDILKEIMSQNWDFFMFVVVETAVVQYLFWDSKDAMLKFFQRIDSQMNNLIKIFSERNKNAYIFIVSDHGYNASPKRCFNFKAWLDENGLLADKRNFIQKIVPQIYNKLGKIKLSKLIFAFNAPKEIRESFQKKVTESSSIYYLYPGLFINRDKLDEDAYEKLRENIIAKLRIKKDPLNEELIFQIVEKRESVYSGKELKSAPDIIIIPNHNYSVVFSYDSNKVIEDIKLHHPGRHFTSMKGIFLAFGDKIRNGELDNVSILDIFPTVLHILGKPIPKDVDGKVLKEIFKKGSDLFDKKIIFSNEGEIMFDEQNKIKSALKNIKI